MQTSANRTNEKSAWKRRWLCAARENKPIVVHVFRIESQGLFRTGKFLTFINCASWNLKSVCANYSSVSCIVPQCRWPTAVNQGQACIRSHSETSCLRIIIEMINRCLINSATLTFCRVCGFGTLLICRSVRLFRIKYHKTKSTGSDASAEYYVHWRGMIW